MKVKKIGFPKFTDFYCNGTSSEWRLERGLYRIDIKFEGYSCDGSGVNLIGAIADKYHWSATNIYAERIALRCYRIDLKSEVGVRLPENIVRNEIMSKYLLIIKYLEDEYEKYIKLVYLED